MREGILVSRDRTEGRDMPPPVPRCSFSGRSRCGGMESDGDLGSGRIWRRGYRGMLTEDPGSNFQQDDVAPWTYLRPADEEIPYITWAEPIR